MSIFTTLAEFIPIGLFTGLSIFQLLLVLGKLYGCTTFWMWKNVLLKK